MLLKKLQNLNQNFLQLQILQSHILHLNHTLHTLVFLNHIPVLHILLNHILHISVPHIRYIFAHHIPVHILDHYLYHYYHNFHNFQKVHSHFSYFFDLFFYLYPFFHGSLKEHSNYAMDLDDLLVRDDQDQITHGSDQKLFLRLEQMIRRKGLSEQVVVVSYELYSYLRQK